MLDKSIPYRNIIMRLDAAAIKGLPRPVLPSGYALRAFQAGDEESWARIESAVLEFDAQADALAYFTREYLGFARELERRCVFVTAPDGRAVATATAWWGVNCASLSWVGVHPAHQSRGLGRAVVLEALSRYPSLEPGRDVYLHTQTWSHVAVGLYHSIGFYMLKTQSFSSQTAGGSVRVHHNDYDQAMSVLESVLSPEKIQSLRQAAR